MASAEREGGFDLDADAVGRNSGAVVGAVNEKPPCLNRLEAGEALLHPILRGHALETEPLCRRRTGGCRHQRLNSGFVGRSVKMDRYLPATVTVIHKAYGGFL